MHLIEDIENEKIENKDLINNLDILA